MSDQQWIAYVGPFLFPWGQPGSRRVYGMARALADLGYRVVVGSGDTVPQSPTLLEDVDGTGSLSYLGLKELPTRQDSLVSKMMQLFWNQGARTVEWIESQATRPAYVMLYGGYAPFMYKLSRWCNKNHVPLIVDVVEWYSPKQLKGGYFGPFHISSKLALRYQFPKARGIIAISNYLADYYRRRGSQVVCIPPTLDIRQHRLLSIDRTDTRLTLVYAGTPGKKDLLANVIQGVGLVDPEGSRIRLQLVGVDSAQVRNLLRAELPNFVQALGRIPQQEVAGVVATSDFSVLLRPSERFAQAGFPTKFVESFAVGTPVIGNLTSDLALHLLDGQTGLVCPDHTSESFASALLRALALNRDQRLAMRHAARVHAEHNFDYRSHLNSLQSFLEKVAARGDRRLPDNGCR